MSLYTKMIEKMITYYFLIDHLPSSRTYMKPLNLSRRRFENGGLYLERWNGKTWVDNPGLNRVSGMGGDSDYDEITEQQAKEFIKAHTNPAL